MVPVDELAVRGVADLGRLLRRPHDVRDQHGGEHAVGLLGRPGTLHEESLDLVARGDERLHHLGIELGARVVLELRERRLVGQRLAIRPV